MVGGDFMDRYTGIFTGGYQNDLSQAFTNFAENENYEKIQKLLVAIIEIELSVNSERMLPLILDVVCAYFDFCYASIVEFDGFDDATFIFSKNFVQDKFHFIYNL